MVYRMTNAFFFLALSMTALCIISSGCKSQKTTLESREDAGFQPIERSEILLPRISERLQIDDEILISLDTHNSWASTGLLSGGGNFRLMAGDYRAWGHLDIRKGGTISSPLHIVGIADPKLHPAVADQRHLVVIEGLSIRGSYSHPPNHPDRVIVDAGHIVIEGITISGNSRKMSADQHAKSPDFMKLGGASNKLNFVTDIEIDRCVIENVVSANALRIFGKRVTVSNSVVRNSYRVPGGDNIGISILSNKAYQSRDITVRNNEIYNCTDGVQIVNVDDDKYDNNAPNVRIENNDIYITDEYIILKDGREYAAAENGIDLKAGGTAQEPVIVRGNSIRGHRYTDESIGGSGGSGAAINLTVNAEHIIIENNVIFDVPIAIVSATTNEKIAILKKADIKVVNNMIYDLYHSRKDDGIAIKGAVGMQVRRNTIVDANVFIWSGYESPFEIYDNVILNESGSRGWSKYHKAVSKGNTWINAKGGIYSGTPSDETIVKDKQVMTRFKPFEISITPITNPTTLKIPYGSFKSEK